MIENIKLLFHIDESKNLDECILDVCLIIAIFLTGVGSILNMLYGNYYILDLVFLVWWLLVLIFRKTYRWLKPLIYIVLIYIVFPYNWVHSSGISGPLPYYSILLAAVISITTRGKYRRFLHISLMILMIIMIYYDQLRLPELKLLNTVTTSIQLLTMVMMISLLLSALTNLYSKEKEQRNLYDSVVEKQNLEQLACMEYLQNINDQINADKHDFNNHLGIIYGLIDSSDYNQAKNYLEKIISREDYLKSIVNMPYSTIRAMLNYKLTLAQKKGVEVITVTDLPADLSFNEFDLAIILANLIDNAIEALNLVSINKFIDIKLAYEPDYLVVRIRNPYNHTLRLEEGIYLSTKVDSKNHGYGLKNICRLAKEHEGMVKINSDNGIFEAYLALLVEYSDE